MKTLIALLVVATSWQIALAADPTADFSPQPTPGGRNFIRVKLERAVPQLFLTPKIFVLKDADTGKIVPLSKVSGAGIHTIVSGITNYRNANLFGTFDVSRDHVLEIGFPDGTAAQTTIAALAEAPKAAGSKSLIQFDRENIKFEVAPFTANGDGIGLSYDVGYLLNSWPVGRAQKLDLDIRSLGELTVASDDDEDAIQNSLKGGVNLSYMYNLRNSFPIGGKEETRVYPLGLKVSPAEFELNKELSLIDYTAKAMVGGAIPYLDYPAVLWSSWNKLTLPFFPPVLFGGIAYVDPLKDEDADRMANQSNARWDTEFIYDMPLANQLALQFTWRSFVGLDTSLWKHNYQIGVVYYPFDQEGNRTHGLFFGYAKGELPPEFNETESWRLGYKLDF